MLPESLVEYVQEVGSGGTTCEEFTAGAIERTKKQGLDAYITLNEKALDEARRIDSRIKKGEKVGRCLGAPIAVKDNICVRGMRTTCASKMLEGYESPYDATVVTRLLAEDAIITGKTNMDEFAMGLTTEFSAYGPSRNPWDKECTPGGSSGGSAAAVGGLECIASLGSDTGGSVRNPASFCGMVGFKPTYGLVSRYGLVSYANSIEQIGPITRTVEDAAFMMDVIAGADPNDATTIECTGGFLDGIDAGIKGKKVALITEMAGEGIDPRVAEATRDAIATLEDAGARCGKVSLDMVKYSVAAYYTITATEAASNLARYDNTMYGYDMPIESYEFHSYISKARRKFGPEVTRRMILGGFVSSSGHGGKYYHRALKVRGLLAREAEEALAEYDLLLSPTVPILPFKLGEKMGDPVGLFLVDYNTVTANLTGKPAASVPYTVCDGLPVGMQLMGRPSGDAEVLQAAYSLQERSRMPEAPPWQ